MEAWFLTECDVLAKVYITIVLCLQANNQGAISVREVHFSYPTRPTVEVLEGLSLSVQPGQTLALVGPSGCGKSSLLALLERFYDPQSGSVVMDSVDIKEINIRWLRSQIGVVSQEPVLFNATIADNIRYGATFDQVGNEEIIEAAMAANIHEFIMGLPQVRIHDVHVCQI